MEQSLISGPMEFLSSIGFLTIAITGYFLMAAVSVFDKYLLHSRISKPSVYAFYVAIFSSFAFFFIPFGFHFPGIKISILSILSGFFFIYGLLALYRAVQENEISRVAPLVGTIIPLVSVVYAYVFLGERLGWLGIWAVFILASGGFLVSFDLPIRNLKLFNGFKYSAVSAVCQAISFGMLKEVLENTEFINGFIWNRAGFFIAGLSLLAFPIFRRQIVRSFKAGKKSKKTVASTGSLFILNKIMAGVGSFLIVLAISKGAVSSVNSVGSVQFAFILGLVSFLSIKHGYIFEEKLSFSDWMQKIFAIILIGLGIWMLAMTDSSAFYLLS